jgi:hypothetical protein
MNSTLLPCEENVGVLTQHEVNSVFHYSPLHYLYYVARDRRLLSKPELMKIGFKEQHFRSTSYKQDKKRGFEEYIHLTIDAHPPILKAKLKGGFPHFELEIPSLAIERVEFHLCRFNIAKTRYLLGAKQAPIESPQNGRYYDDKKIPIAQTHAERLALFEANFNKNMIEVLVPNILELPDSTIVTLFHAEDLDIAQELMQRIGVKWQLRLENLDDVYKRKPENVQRVQSFIAQALDDPNWKGNGLEFDRV